MNVLEINDNTINNQHVMTGLFDHYISKEEQLERKISQNEREIAALEQRWLEVERDCNALFEALEVRPEQIHKLLGDPSDQEIDRELSDLPDPEKARRSMQSLQVKPGWLFIK
jgi:chromosome segregation ATPase